MDQVWSALLKSLSRVALPRVYATNFLLFNDFQCYYLAVRAMMIRFARHQFRKLQCVIIITEGIHIDQVLIALLTNLSRVARPRVYATVAGTLAF